MSMDSYYYTGENERRTLTKKRFVRYTFVTANRLDSCIKLRPGKETILTGQVKAIGERSVVLYGEASPVTPEWELLFVFDPSRKCDFIMTHKPSAWNINPFIADPKYVGEDGQILRFVLGQTLYVRCVGVIDYPDMLVAWRREDIEERARCENDEAIRNAI